MMKSFFKKLSLVMALAMVVSMMAPAASAFAADLIIAGQEEAKADAKESYSVEVGKEVDFKFYGAAAGWQDLYKWESADETIAKPLVNEKGEQDGRFEGLKDGEVEVTLTIGEQKATVKLVVGKGNVVVEDKSFEVKQTTANTVEITFADAKYATKDIAVTKLGKTTTGTVTEIVWPVNKVELKDNKATVTTWVDFGTGEYRFTANGESVDAATAVGYPDFAVITYKNTYTYADNNNAASTPEIAVYDANGVKLTGYTNWYFELLNTDANAYVENTTGNLYLWSVGAVANIKATLTYVVGTETKTVECPVVVTCQAKPAYTVNNYIEKYAVTESGTAFDKIVWGKSDVIINNEKAYYVTGIIKDSLDKTKSFNVLFTDKDNALLDGYYVRYASSNPSVALVNDVTGEILGVNTGSAYVLVSLYKNATPNDIAVGVIAAIPVNVCAAKKATVLTLDKYVDTLLTEGEFTTSTVTATVKDQYNGDKADPIDSVYAKVNDKEYSSKNGFVEITADNKFKVDAKNFKDVTVNSISFEVKTKSGLKANYVLTIKKLPEKVNETYALKVDGANIALGNDFDGAANVSVVSAWAGSSYKNKDFYYGKPETCKVDDLYVTITGPDGKDLTATSATTAALVFNAITSNATTDGLKTMALGQYIVKLNLVTQVATGSDDKQIVNTVLCDTKVFEIKNSLPGVTDFKVKSNKYTTGAIATDTVEFKVNGVAWNGSNFTVDAADVNAKELNGNVYVYDFTVKIPYDGGFYTKKVTVNQLFTK